jgi:hypothetical protein
LITPQLRAFYLAAPPDVKEQIIAGIIKPGLAALGYNQLDPKKDPLPNMHLLAGNYLATDSYGWSEFSIDPQTQQLRITTYGITPNTQDQLEADPSAITAQTPQIVSDFVVTPNASPRATAPSLLAASADSAVDAAFATTFSLGRSATNLNLLASAKPAATISSNTSASSLRAACDRTSHDIALQMATADLASRDSFRLSDAPSHASRIRPSPVKDLGDVQSADLFWVLFNEQ